MSQLIREITPSAAFGEMIVYFPRGGQSDDDLTLASEVMFRFGFGLMYVAWCHEHGNVPTTGPFPYPIKVIPDAPPD